MSDAPHLEAAILSAALELSPPERAAYLDQACAGDAALRQQVEALLRAHEQAEDFLKGPPAGFALKGTVLLEILPTEKTGDKIGRYKLLQPIGEGGCGVVYMAEQEEPVRRRVALKVIKLGMDTKSVIARFEAERQALAMMDHPNIAKVLDAGATDAGRPFFVMELVRGIKITEFCDESKLSTEDRLKLFIQVCQAIQHAHQKGVIHRDIKPSNILVTINDGVPVPKVIDFGIAKATAGRLTDQTLFTAFEQFIGTPAYMSPEQAVMTSLDIDTRSDIYSLGVLLYELLTGHTPFDAKELLAAGLDEMRRTIREQEPPRPSTRLSTMTAAALTTTAKQRHTDAPKLVHLLRGDVDWIVMKCLEKDRARRYETANGLAADVQRHLANEPVVARPRSTAYKIQKAWQRNKLVLTAGLAVFLALAAGLTVATVGWVQTASQRNAAVLARAGEETQRKQAEANENRAVRERQGAELAREETRRRAYAAEISAAFQALDENNLGRALDLLNRQRPKPGEEDQRGFEWRRLWQLCQADEKVTFRGEGGSALAFSPDGRWLAYGGDRVVIRELPSRFEVKTIPNAATTLAFSPQGNLLASGHDSNVRLWSTESWQEVRSLPDARYPALFSPDGQWLVTGTPGGYRVWNTDTWEPARFCSGEPLFRDQSREAVAFSSDGKLLVTAGHPGGPEVAQFQVWDFPSLTARTNFESFPFKLGSAVFAPDGKHLLIGDWAGVLMVWDVAEGRKVETLYEHTGKISAIRYSHDGLTFATASADRTVILWDAATRQMLVRLRGHLEEVWSVAMSPDGSMLASRSREGTTKLWDATTRHERRTLPGCGLITGFSADSRLLVVQGFRPDVGFKGYRLWHLANGAVTNIPLDNYEFRGTDAWGDVHGVEPHAVFGRFNGVLEHWNLATMTRVASWRVHEGEVKSTAFSPDGQLIATRGEQGDVKVWQAGTHREVRRFEIVREKLAPSWNVLTFSPDGRMLAASGGSEKNSRICIWDVNSGRLLPELDMPGDERVPAYAFSPDSKLLATAHWDNTARLWDLGSGKQRAIFKGHVQAVLGVAFSPDSKTLATGGDDRKVKLWNIATEQEMATLDLLPGGCRALRFSPDGRTLAASCIVNPEPSIWLWAVPSFEEIAAAEAKEKTQK